MNVASAPGKIILFGEHAVVYGRPALAVPVTQVQATAQVGEAATPGVWIEAPDISLSARLEDLPADHPLGTVVRSVFTDLGLPLPATLKVHVSSTIPVASGLGSGAAVSVAILRALSEYLGRPLPDERVSALAYEVEKLHHGTPSGIDNTVVTYAKPVYFVRGEPIETLRVGKPLTFVVADTGVAAPTRESVGDVRRLWQARPAQMETIFDSIGEIVRRARRAIQAGETAEVGSLMNENHYRLQQLTVSSPELDRLVEAARQAGSLGAKLSGGGRGGNMLALVPQEAGEAVAAALRSAGAVRTIATRLT